VSKDILDGATSHSTFFTIDLVRVRPHPPVRVVLAHVLHDGKARQVVKAGEQIGTAAGEFVHLGCTSMEDLKAILAA
jgi:hypothetical protein